MRRSRCVGIGIRERMEEDGIDHAENCRTGGDPEAERDHRDNE